MPERRHLLLASAGLPLLAQAGPASAWLDATELARRTEALRNAELAFAASMAERNFAAFRAALAEDCVFFNSRSEPLIGAELVSTQWQRFYEGPKAPFSWSPDQVVVLPSGELGRSTGPVRDPEGKVVQRFQSIWRWHADGGWRIVFDFGTPVA
ncbi:ketosteroid isomerase-like protein [Inhella inkyongensis]|uniref:Ketosteroid isomerase-like protein n=1 Tax=Inhella inkyongensis TaxID=392593 RepID=A0A840S5R1_9BURK|nr:nuclear transport factor 2 family protein [Inhella inkyongensis]MBB5204912.1 ketosteroid isomerase-like protein [Inhella inkyongensis]